MELNEPSDEVIRAFNSLFSKSMDLHRASGGGEVQFRQVARTCEICYQNYQLNPTGIETPRTKELMNRMNQRLFDHLIEEHEQVIARVDSLITGFIEEEQEED